MTRAHSASLVTLLDTAHCPHPVRPGASHISFTFPTFVNHPLMDTPGRQFLRCHLMYLPGMYIALHKHLPDIKASPPTPTNSLVLSPLPSSVYTSRDSAPRPGYSFCHSALRDGHCATDSARNEGTERGDILLKATQLVSAGVMHGAPDRCSDSWSPFPHQSHTFLWDVCACVCVLSSESNP